MTHPVSPIYGIPHKESAQDNGFGCSWCSFTGRSSFTTCFLSPHYYTLGLSRRIVSEMLLDALTSGHEYDGACIIWCCPVKMASTVLFRAWCGITRTPATSIILKVIRMAMKIVLVIRANAFRLRILLLRTTVVVPSKAKGSRNECRNTVVWTDSEISKRYGPGRGTYLPRPKVVL